MMYNLLTEAIEKADSIAIGGHIRPDGDCVGSTSALYNYLRLNYPDKKLAFFLEMVPPEMKEVLNVPEPDDPEKTDEVFDLFVSLDSSTLDRLGKAQEIFKNAKHSLVIDHHITNLNYGDSNVVKGDASSCCEVLFDLLDPDKIDLDVANSLYLGMVHDTGVFKYSSTNRHTMEAAGLLLEKGIDTSRLIDVSFYEKSWNQNKLLGLALDKAELYLDGYVAGTVLTREDLEKCGCTMYQTDGIVEQLRLTRGVEVAFFAREDEDDLYKFSLRSKTGEVDVSQISVICNGGGHKMAAGYTASGKIDVLISKLLDMIVKLKNHKE